MRVKTAFVEGPNPEGREEVLDNITVEEVELDEPKEDEVLIDIEACGVCHSDWGVAKGEASAYYPTAIGHEAAGVVSEVGRGVSHVEPGDHVVTSYIPPCGRCERCAQGHQELCVRGQYLEKGPMLDGTFRYHRDNGEDIGQFVLLGTFSEATVVHKDAVIPIPEDIPLEAACLTGCGVSTGFGASAHRADIHAGDTTVHFGFGGVGANAVQGALAEGADDVIVVDPVEKKRNLAEEFGATYTINPDEEEPADVVRELTHGKMADTAVITVDVAHPEIVGQALSTVGGRGEVIMISIPPAGADHIDLAGEGLDSIVGFERELKGALYGGWSPNYAVPNLLEMYQKDTIKLDELISKRYELDEIHQAFEDMLDGENIRGVIKP